MASILSPPIFENAETAWAETQDYGILENANCNKNIFKNNVVHGYQTGGFSINGTGSIDDGNVTEP